MVESVSADRQVRIVNTPRLHVLHVVDALALGGAERMLVEIANRTVFDGYRVSVCVTRTGIELAARLDPRIDLLVLGRQKKLELSPLVRLVRWIRAHDVDAIHCHGRSSFSLIALIRLTHAISAPVIMHDHLGVEIHPRIPAWFRVAKRYLSTYASVYEQQLEWARRAGVPADRVALISNAIDTQALIENAKASEGSLPEIGVPRIVFVGGLRREKGVDVLLEAFAALKTQGHLYIIGGDTNREYAEACRQRAEAADLKERVTFLGQRADALALARQADLAVHSARSESGPLVLAEYATLGIPFVSTRVGGIATTLASEGIGDFVPPDDANALTFALEQMLSLSSESRRELGRQGIAKARLLFDISSVMPQWYRVYARVQREHP